MFKKTKIHKAVVSLLTGSLLVSHASVIAAPLELADTPPGSGYKPPKPNVILSFDNSGSMTWDDRGCFAADSANAYDVRIQNNAIYVRRDQAQWMWHCPYETTTAGQFRTRNQQGNWNGFREYIFNGSAYYRADTPVSRSSRMQTLKATLPVALNNTVADGSIRLAWQSLHNTTANNGYSVQSIARGATNSMRSFEGQHRTNFNNYLANMRSGGGTPTHRLMFGAHDYMANPSLGIDSPWAKDPGVTAAPYLGCRRAYHIVLSDGEWNGQYAAVLPPNGNQDQDSIANVGGSGQSYNPNADWARVFRGTEAGTLADWAFTSWAQDLQPRINNEIEPLSDYKAAPNTSVHGGVTVPKFWNPRYNPASWQHMITFSIGYGSSAYAWGARPRFEQTWLTQPANILADNYGGDFNQLYQGTVTWPNLNVGPGTDSRGGNNRQSDLWHMALNGRGKFYPVDNGDRLTAAFSEIFRRISSDNQPGTGNTSASGTNNVYTDVGLYTTGFDSTKAWKGYVDSRILTTAGTTVPNPDWGVDAGQAVTTADKLDALTPAQIKQRLILSVNDATSIGVPFVWKDNAGRFTLSEEQRKALSGSTADEALGEQRVDYLRGDRSREDDRVFRKRQSRQGDIVNSNVWYVGKPASGYGDASYLSFVRSARSADDAMIYVGGNDGMLHGFSAKNGQERIAYVPKGVVPALHELTNPKYEHKFYVDGSPFAGDVKVGSQWKTMLVGTLGAGGRGYFVLDVTDPDSFNSSNAGSLVVLDATQVPRDKTGLPDAAGVDPDLGHIFSAPVPHETYSMRASQVAKMNNGRWAVVLGNGYNSANEKPVLYIQYLDGDKSVHKLAPTVVGSDAQENGLSAPRLVDINGDDTPDVIYAGDLKGNMWKFDVTSNNPAQWNVAFAGQPLFKACERSDATGTVVGACVPQPITAAPTVRINDAGRGMMVAFGTGRNLTIADRSSTDKQAVYSVLDNTRYKARSGAAGFLEVHPGARATASTAAIAAPQALAWNVDLVNQTVNSVTQVGQGVSAGTNFWNTSANAVDWSNAATQGWFVNLPESGERVLQTMSFYDGSNILMVNSLVPARGTGDLHDETCEAQPEAGKRYLTLLNIMTGKPPSVQLMDLNGDGVYNVSDLGVSRMSLRPDSVTVTKTDRGSVVSSSGGGNALPQQNKLAPMPIQAVRPSWRQLQ